MLYKKMASLHDLQKLILTSGFAEILFTYI